MRKLGKPLLILVAIAVFCVVALPGEAQDQKKKNAKKAAKGPDPLAKMLSGIDLTAEQQAKVGELKKEYGPKLADLQKRRFEVMTPDRRKVEKEAKKLAKDAGKKGKEAKAAVEEALGLSPAERDRVASIQKEEQALRAQLTEQARALLTAEQKARLPEPAKREKEIAEEGQRLNEARNSLTGSGGLGLPFYASGKLAVTRLRWARGRPALPPGAAV